MYKKGAFAHKQMIIIPHTLKLCELHVFHTHAL